MKPVFSLTLTAAAFLLLTQLAGPFAAFAQLTLTSPLALSPSSPAPGQVTTATFTAKNSGTGTATIPYFLVGARSPSKANVDFPPSPPVTLGPGQTYTYRGTHSFSSAGTYSAWPV